MLKVLQKVLNVMLYSWNINGIIMLRSASPFLILRDWLPLSLVICDVTHSWALCSGTCTVWHNTFEPDLLFSCSLGFLCYTSFGCHFLIWLILDFLFFSRVTCYCKLNSLCSKSQELWQIDVGSKSHGWQQDSCQKIWFVVIVSDENLY